jgi:hypothetical protein
VWPFSGQFSLSPALFASKSLLRRRWHKVCFSSWQPAPDWLVTAAIERFAAAGSNRNQKEIAMETMMHMPFLVAAAGYSLVYLLAGGGVGGAIVIFVIAKLLGR